MDLSSVPQKYHKWSQFFENVTDARALLKHQLWNHKIKLLSGTTLLFEVFRPIKKKRLKKLREYLKENLVKNFVKKSTLPIKHAVFFVLKKNDNN